MLRSSMIGAMPSKRVCFFSPYFTDTHLGGGERHLLSVAHTVAQEDGVRVVIAVSSLNRKQLTPKKLTSYRDTYQTFTGFDLSSVEFIETPLFTSAPWWRKLWWTKQFDYLYYATDGSLFISLAPFNNLHIQVPFTHSLSLADTIKLWTWQYKNTNSKFTQKHIEKHWKTKVDQVHYPVINTAEFAPDTPKKPIILSVGRFFSHLHGKKQDVLITAFERLYKKMSRAEQRQWQLVLVGSIEDEQFVQELKRRARDLPIVFRHDISRRELVSLYNHARIYWHAAGYNENPKTTPERLEHFGIATVESMAAGAVPVVFPGGGQREIIGSRTPFSPLSWQEPAECAATTLALLRDPERERELGQKAVIRAEKFGRAVFEAGVKKQFATVLS